MLGNFFESIAPRLLPTLHSALKNQCLRYPSGSAHVAAGLSESADPGWPGDLGVGVGLERVPELEVIQAQGWLKAKARGGGW